MLAQSILALAIASTLIGCSTDHKDQSKKESSDKTSQASSGAEKKSEKSTDKPDDKAVAKLLISPEDVLTVQSNALASGPVITGSIQPERKADLRAEISAIVLQVYKENGDVVKRGDILLKLDETSIRDNLNSAQDNARSASLALEQADRSLQRLKTLRASGMASLQAIDEAELRLNSAKSELSASKARAASALQQLQHTVVRAPFDGLISERKVSAGDTAGIGKELIKVIDPASMRFAGRVSADKIAMVKIGQPVSFHINGYHTQEFRGSVTRIDPAANDVTRQVEVLVGFSGDNLPRVSGLYAEGSIEAASVNAVTLPETSITKAGDKSYAWRVSGKILQRVDMQIGSRDQRTGHYEVRTGIKEGDIIMRNPNSSFKDGQSIEMLGAKLRVASADMANSADSVTTLAQGH